MTNSSAMAVAPPLASLHQYIRFVRSFPKLDAEEERALAERLRRSDDLSAAWRLVTSHLRYVVFIAQGYRGYGLPMEDLIQEGNVGLMKAVRRFDPGRGVRLLAYATHWIRAHIHEFILRNWRIVRIVTTKAKRKLFYKLRGAKKRLTWLSDREAREIADDLDVDPDDVRLMEASLYLPDEPLEAPVDADGDETWSPGARLAAERAEPERLVAEAEYWSKAERSLRRALPALDPRSREIIERRWLSDDAEKPTLQELGEHFGISAERVRQLEVRALQRLRGLLLPQLGEDVA